MSLEARARAALETALAHLTGARGAEGYWEGRLSSSALSTATAISALAGARRAADAALIGAGLAWLARTQNADGGWGDTADSPSNLSTTILCVCAIKMAEKNDCGLRIADCGLTKCGMRSRRPTGPSHLECGIDDCGLKEHVAGALGRAEAYISARAGTGVEERVAAIRGIYGEDRTFATPILMNCALAGLVPWSVVPPLPFELALLPRGFYKILRLHVVSYALPALIAVGGLIHKMHRSANPVAARTRDWALRPAVGLLDGLQPASGGFLEATPLTSFVAMSLIPLVGPEHPVAAKCLEFLRASAREDGAWPIDTNLAVWMTTGAVGALGRAGALERIDGARTRAWIAARQWRRTHPFTGAAPGGFAWTHLSGGVPDADDTAGAMLALARLGEREALGPAARWLLDLQNGDGGWPTFCRGWGKLPFDRSAPDLTAHVLRALLCASRLENECGAGEFFAAGELARAIARGFRYLETVQRGDGAWVPLWFGNQLAPAMENPVLGTARALLAWAERDGEAPAARRGVEFLIANRNPDGGWGGARGVASTVEETALAAAALTHWSGRAGVKEALESGVQYLVERVERGTWLEAAPIGLYFSSLWYSEALYPAIWTVEALGMWSQQMRNDELRIADCGLRIEK